MSFQKRNTHKHESKKMISQPVNDTSEQKYPKKMTTYLNKVYFKTKLKSLSMQQENLSYPLHGDSQYARKKMPPGGHVNVFDHSK